MCSEPDFVVRDIPETLRKIVKEMDGIVRAEFREGIPQQVVLKAGRKGIGGIYLHNK